MAQSDIAQQAKRHLECPMCRTAHVVAHGNFEAFVAAHLASNFGEAPPTPRAMCRNEGLASLSVGEIRLVASELRLDVRGAVERGEMERSIESQLERRVPLGEPPPHLLTLLPLRCLRAILDERSIPHDDCNDQQALVRRIEQSPKGSCLDLPPRVLKRMLATFGLVDEMHIDKAELARTVMAGRVLHKARQEESRQHRQQWQQRQQHAQGSTNTQAHVHVHHLPEHVQHLYAQQHTRSAATWQRQQQNSSGAHTRQVAPNEAIARESANRNDDTLPCCCSVM